MIVVWETLPLEIQPRRARIELGFLSLDPLKTKH